MEAEEKGRKCKFEEKKTLYSSLAVADFNLIFFFNQTQPVIYSDFSPYDTFSSYLLCSDVKLLYVL